MTVPGVLLIVSSLGITSLFAVGPGGCGLVWVWLNVVGLRTHTHTHTGAIPWLMVSELFLQEGRAVAVTIATIVNWLANFVVGLAFPYILVCEIEQY